MGSETHDAHIDYPTLNRFADGELAGRSRAAVQSHLRSCAVCRKEVQFIRTLGNAIRALPTPRPPEQLFDDLFGEQPSDREIPVLQGPWGAPRKSLRPRWLSLAACGLALVATVLLLTVGSDPVMAGSSTLTIERADTGRLALRYQTISPLAAETSVRARIRYWIPDSLRFAQTEPGFSAVALSREDPGTFAGVADLPPGTVYAAATVEDLRGTYLDSDFGRFWEYLEADADGRPTLQARRYQVLAALEFNAPRAEPVARRATSEFPGQPEFWSWLLSFERAGLPAASIDTLLSTHAARLTVLDRAARDGNPGAVEIYALSRYARLLERTDLADYWRSELRARYPLHGAAALVNLQAILVSRASSDEKLSALEEDWASVGAPATVQLGLRYSYEFADPILTEKWLDRYEASSWGRSLSSDTEVARSLMEVPALWPLAELWILDRLSYSRDWVGPARRLDQSRYNFEAETRQNRAHLYLYLSRIRRDRGDLAGGIDALERSVEATWDPRVFVRAAEIHRSLGSDVRAAQLISLAQVDPVAPLEPYLAAEDDPAWRRPPDPQLAAARAAMRERIVAGLLDQHVNLNAGLRTETGEETTLARTTGTDRGVTLVLYALRPDLVPNEAFALLGINSDRLGSAGVGTVVVSEQPDPLQSERPGTDFRFHYDPDLTVWKELRAWRSVQYFVLDRAGRLRHRGEDLEAALRISLVLAM
ncbi:anti-sigma factor family protein [Candidatus Palauibacter sp.]|uniref:anti-sigma factor family protein n=1 Tax=Candidatus Palauibacter sp. TaxID=3101350 RepID=UPI003B5D047C